MLVGPGNEKAVDPKLGELPALGREAGRRGFGIGVVVEVLKHGPESKTNSLREQ
jgi:hypothetical protein